MGDFIATILKPIEVLVAWIMYGFHQFFAAIGLPEASGLTWALSIVGLVIVMRAAMIPLFVRQIHASRRMQLIQPEMMKIQKKYKGKNDPDSKQAQQREMMALYRDSGTNPFSSCLPILLQSPFFFGLFRVLNSLDEIGSGKNSPIGPITQQVAAQAESAKIFGAQLSDSFGGFSGASTMNVKIVTLTLIVLMSVSTFTSQYQLMRKNMPAAALDNPFAKQQKIILYLMPAFFAISGINFPIGVLIYWCVTNVWSMCQQFYVIRRMPTPGSPAHQALTERNRRRGKETKEITLKGVVSSSDEAETTAKSGQRVQPTSKKRNKKKGGSGGSKPKSTSATAPGSASPSKGSGSPTKASQPSAPGSTTSSKSKRNKQKPTGSSSTK